MSNISSHNVNTFPHLFDTAEKIAAEAVKEVLREREQTERKRRYLLNLTYGCQPAGRVSRPTRH